MLSLDASKQHLDEHFFANALCKQLNNATSCVKVIATQGIIQNGNAICLTMDLCPSTKQGYESAFIEKLAKQKCRNTIAIALSSAWKEHHKKEFETLVKKPTFRSTWVNHTHIPIFTAQIIHTHPIERYHKCGVITFYWSLQMETDYRCRICMFIR